MLNQTMSLNVKPTNLTSYCVFVILCFVKDKIVSKVKRGSEIACYQVLVVIFNVTVPHSWMGNMHEVTGGCRWSSRNWEVRSGY